MHTPHPKPDSSHIVVLYVEDDAATAEIFRILVSELEPASKVFTFAEGAPALTFLLQQPPYTDAPRPDLIVLDINLPSENGFDVLRRIRQEPQLAAVPAVFFSTSDSLDEHRLSRDLGALALVHKPVQLEQFEMAVQLMLQKVAR